MNVILLHDRDVISMRFELYKILDSKYVSDLVNGKLYMNPLDFFRKIEGNNAQNDPFEGICGVVCKEQLKQYGINFDSGLMGVIKGNVPLISDYFGLNNIFCLYRLLIDDNNKIIYTPSETLREFNNSGKSEKVVVRIKNTKKFIGQIDSAIQREIKNKSIEYGIYGSVIYSDLWSNADGLGKRSVFHKDLKYSYQNEWRLCILRHMLDKDSYILEIGDISNITDILSLEEFISYTNETYPGYSSVNFKKSFPQINQFQIHGTINTVNNLMFSYMQSDKDQLVRSDQAQADWHYAQYLKLNGKQEKIDIYLEKRMRETLSLEHLELLVQHRLTAGEWVKATDAFMFFIEEAPQIIESDSGRFFFNLHTILMQHQEFKDAARLYIKANKQYGIPKELKNIMLSDVLFALGFYDQVIPMYTEIQKTNNDPILDLYLAVSYFFTLDLENANHYLVRYEKYFSNSLHSAQKTKQLRTLINCFKNKVKMDIALQEYLFQKLEWTDDLEIQLGSLQQKKMYVGLDFLYLFEKTHKWDIIKEFQEVVVTTQSIARIIELYEKSGDPIFFGIINSLIDLSNIEVRSPNLLHYLALDMAKPELLPYLKMEQAFYLQEIQDDIIDE